VVALQSLRGRTSDRSWTASRRYPTIKAERDDGADRCTEDTARYSNGSRVLKPANSWKSRSLPADGISILGGARTPADWCRWRSASRGPVDLIAQPCQLIRSSGSSAPAVPTAQSGNSKALSWAARASASKSTTWSAPLLLRLGAQVTAGRPRQVRTGGHHVPTRFHRRCGTGHCDGDDTRCKATHKQTLVLFLRLGATFGEGSSPAADAPNLGGFPMVRPVTQG
jgi:hypothetical protein